MKAIYKCRLCGQTYSSGAHTGPTKAAMCMAMLVAGLVNTEPMAPRLLDSHVCNLEYSGSIGLADFQGWKKEDTDE